MNSVKKTIVLIIVVFLASTVSAQQSQPFTQYLFSRFLLNPAACGADGYSSVGLTAKNQWTGFPDAPVNQTLTAQTRLQREGLFGKRRWYNSANENRYTPERVGLGVALFNDMRGPIRTTGGNFTYAYHIEDLFGQLSFGLTASFFQLNINRNKIETEFDDPYLNGNKLNSFVPDASFGVHYTTSDFYAGFSASNLFQSLLSFGDRSSSKFRIERQYHILGGYVFDINDRWSFVPGTQIRFNERIIAQIDVNLMCYYYNNVWGGFSYRSGGGGAFGGSSLLFGVRYNQYHFGYAFDYTLSGIQNYSYGSHELMLSITFGLNEQFFRYKRRYEFKNSENVRRIRRKSLETDPT